MTTNEASESSATPQRGIQSVEVGGQLLQALVHHGAPLPLKDLARASGMSSAKAHPYLVSFMRLGLVVQREDGRYGLGSLALEMGLISLQQVNPVQMATPLLGPLARRIGQTVAIAVWGARGPTIVRIEESPETVFASLRHGTVFSLSGTASGRLFAAHLAPARVRMLLDEERRSLPSSSAPSAWKAFQAQLAEVRRIGLARSVGEIVEGVNAMAAPVFAAGGDMVLALIAIGPTGRFDVSPDGEIAAGLLDASGEVTRQLGGSAVRQAAPS